MSKFFETNPYCISACQRFGKDFIVDMAEEMFKNYKKGNCKSGNNYPYNDYIKKLCQNGTIKNGDDLLKEFSRRNEYNIKNKCNDECGYKEIIFNNNHKLPVSQLMVNLKFQRDREKLAGKFLCDKVVAQAIEQWDWNAYSNIEVVIIEGLYYILDGYGRYIAMLTHPSITSIPTNFISIDVLPDEIKGDMEKVCNLCTELFLKKNCKKTSISAEDIFSLNANKVQNKEHDIVYDFIPSLGVELDLNNEAMKLSKKESNMPKKSRVFTYNMLHDCLRASQYVKNYDSEQEASRNNCYENLKNVIKAYCWLKFDIECPFELSAEVINTLFGPEGFFKKSIDANKQYNNLKKNGYLDSIDLSVENINIDNSKEIKSIIAGRYIDMIKDSIRTKNWNDSNIINDVQQLIQNKKKSLKIINAKKICTICDYFGMNIKKESKNFDIVRDIIGYESNNGLCGLARSHQKEINNTVSNCE